MLRKNIITAVHAWVLINNSVSLEIFHSDQIKLVVGNGSMLVKRFDGHKQSSHTRDSVATRATENAPIRYAQICTQQVYQEVPHARRQAGSDDMYIIHKHKYDKHATYVCTHV